MTVRLTLSQAANHIGVSPATLHSWYAADRGPKGFKIGGRIFYLRSDLDAWTDNQMATTSRGGLKVG